MATAEEREVANLREHQAQRDEDPYGHLLAATSELERLRVLLGELLAACKIAAEALTPHGDEAYGKRSVIRRQVEATIAKAEGKGVTPCTD